MSSIWRELFSEMVDLNPWASGTEPAAGLQQYADALRSEQNWALGRLVWPAEMSATLAEGLAKLKEPNPWAVSMVGSPGQSLDDLLNAAEKPCVDELIVPLTYELRPGPDGWTTAAIKACKKPLEALKKMDVELVLELSPTDQLLDVAAEATQQLNDVGFKLAGGFDAPSLARALEVVSSLETTLKFGLGTPCFPSAAPAYALAMDLGLTARELVPLLEGTWECRGELLACGPWTLERSQLEAYQCACLGWERTDLGLEVCT